MDSGQPTSELKSGLWLCSLSLLAVPVARSRSAAFPARAGSLQSAPQSCSRPESAPWPSQSMASFGCFPRFTPHPFCCAFGLCSRCAAGHSRDSLVGSTCFSESFHWKHFSGTEALLPGERLGEMAESQKEADRKDQQWNQHRPGRSVVGHGDKIPADFHVAGFWRCIPRKEVRSDRKSHEKAKASRQEDRSDSGADTADYDRQHCGCN